MATTFAPDVTRDAKAREIAEGAGQWVRITLREQHGAFKAGTKFYGVPSSEGQGRYYLTNLRFCSCPAYANYAGACKHQRAVAYHALAVRRARRQQQNGEASPASPAPRTRTRRPGAGTWSSDRGRSAPAASR